MKNEESCCWQRRWSNDVDVVPSHVGNFERRVVGFETHHVGVENSEAIDVAFFGVSAEELLPDADAQQWLCDAANEFVEPVLLQVFHGGTCFADAGKNHFVGGENRARVVGRDGVYADSPKSAVDREDIAGIIFDDCYLHCSFRC